MIFALGVDQELGIVFTALNTTKPKRKDFTQVSPCFAEAHRDISATYVRVVRQAALDQDR